MSAADELPLDDARWLPLLDIVLRLNSRTGDLERAAHDLTEALALGSVHAMQRSITTGRKLLPSSYWGNTPVPGKTVHALVARPDGLYVGNLDEVSGIPRTLRTFPLAPTYAWEPDCKAVWPEL